MKPVIWLQKLQTGDMLMQNSIIYGLCAIVAWHYEKKKIMKPSTISHEILLFTGTGFTSRHICSKDNQSDKGKNLSPLEELEKACWDGLLYEIFPEIVSSFSVKYKIFIWHIMSGKNYLCISLGPGLVVLENETVIDPYFFTFSVCEN